MKKVPKRQIKEILSNVKCPNDCACSSSGLNKECLSEFTTVNKFPRYTQIPCRQKDVSFCKMKVFIGAEAFCRCPARINIIRRISNLASIIPTEQENGKKQPE